MKQHLSAKNGDLAGRKKIAKRTPKTNKNKDFSTYKCDACDFTSNASKFITHMLNAHDMRVDSSYITDNHLVNPQLAVEGTLER